MSAAAGLIHELRSRGVMLWCENDKVRYRTSSGALADADLAQLRTLKEEVRALLRHSAAPAALAPPPADRPTTAPLSVAQQGLWALDQRGLSGPAHNIRAVLELTGVVDEQALERCLAHIVDRHECLRTRFERYDSAPLQVIDAPQSFTLQRLDVSLVSQAERDARVAARVRQEIDHRFDLTAGDLFRVCLVKRAAQAYVLVVSISHLIADGWSLGVLTRELALLYAACVQGCDSPLPPLPVSYSEYVRAQHARVQPRLLEQQLNYWRTHLAGAPAALALPADRARPPALSYRGAIHRFTVPLPLTGALRELARQQRATLFMTLLAVFSVLLNKLSSQSEVVIGTLVSGRTERRLETLIGCFVNTLALRVKHLPGQPFHQHLAAVRAVVLQAFAHQEVPFEAVVQELQPQRSLVRHPIFQVMLVMENPAGAALQLPGLQLRLVNGEHVTTKFDLVLAVRELPTQLQCWFEYATDLFEAASIERFAGYFVTLLERSALPLAAARDAGLARPEYIAPRNEVERRVAEAWAAALGIERIGALDNFFALGGKSLLVMDVTLCLQEFFAVELPLKSLFEDQTVERWSQRIEVLLRENAPGDQPATHASTEHHVQVVDLASGPGPVLYCLPGTYGDGREFARLGAALAGERTVIAFVCHTLGPRRWQITSIREIAAGYARLIAERSTEQGCALVGWSFGGDLAVEVARQLRGRVAVRFLGAVDVADREDILALGAPARPGGEGTSSDAVHACQRILDWMQTSAMSAQWQQLLADMNPQERAATLQFMAADSRPLPTDGPTLDSKEYDKWVLTRLAWMRRRHSLEAEHAIEVGLHSWTAEATARDPRYRQRAWGERVSVQQQQIVAGTTHKSILEHPDFIAGVRAALHAAEGACAVPLQ